jgi:type IV pilus assembly protein PilB
MMAKPLLGEMLIENGEITQEQLDEAIKMQKSDGGLIGIILVNLGYIPEKTLVKYLAMQAERVVKSD